MLTHKNCGSMVITTANGEHDCCRCAGPLTSDQVEVIL